MPEIRFAPEDSPLSGPLAAFRARCRDRDPSRDGGPARPTTVTVIEDPAVVPADGIETLLRRAADGDTAILVAVCGTTVPDAILRAAGVRIGTRVPAHPVRLGGGPAGDVLRGLGDRPEPMTPLCELLPDDDGTVTVLTAPLGLRRVAVATWRPDSGVLTLGLDPVALAAGTDDSGRRILYRLASLASGADPAGLPLPRVGLLGYGAIGAEHVAGFGAAGFDVVAVCDRSEARLEAAGEVLPGVRTYQKTDEFMGDPDVELVAISTPPDSHAHWARVALESGRHAVVEKPLALGAAEADSMLDAAADAGLILAVYQNRRFDRDFLAVQDLARSGRLGRLFHVEAFVGGYEHPCNYWHSDAAVSGGTAFDWGSHYLDQVLALLPGSIESVRGSAHKLRWHDVTNADQVRIQLRFTDGTEAEFVHSDLAAALKPKWYVLGTEGAVVAEWRRERVVGRTPIGLLDEDHLAPADSPAVVWWHHPDGSRTEVALPAVAPGRYHRELAAHLALGEPLTADPNQSRDVVAVLEAAVASAEAGGEARRPAMRGR